MKRKDIIKIEQVEEKKFQLLLKEVFICWRLF